jgi:hypothetical protein
MRLIFPQTMSLRWLPYNELRTTMSEHTHLSAAHLAAKRSSSSQAKLTDHTRYKSLKRQHCTSLGEERQTEGESHQKGSHWLPVSHHIRRVAPRHCSRHERSYVNNQTIFRRRVEGDDAYELGFCLPFPLFFFPTPRRPGHCATTGLSIRSLYG